MVTSASIPPGCVFRHDRFYLSRETGEFEPKYLVSLAETPGVARLPQSVLAALLECTANAEDTRTAGAQHPDCARDPSLTKERRAFA